MADYRALIGNVTLDLAYVCTVPDILRRVDYIALSAEEGVSSRQT